MAASPDGRSLYIGCASANQVLVFDRAQGVIARRLAMPAAPSGLALSGEGTRLFVTCAAPVSPVVQVELPSGKVLSTLTAGHTALSPVLSADGRVLFVCNRFNDAVSVFDLKENKESARIAVSREPVSAALTRDGRFLLVANHQPKGRNDVSYVAATVSVIDVAQRKVAKELRLPNGSIGLREIPASARTASTPPWPKPWAGSNSR